MSDLINRREAINTALTFLVEYCGAAFDEDMQKMLKDRLDSLPAAQTDLSGYSDKLWRIAYERGKAEAMRWIPCSVQLPENGHNYLYCTDMGTVHMGFYWGGLGFGYGFKYGYDIVAWMPIPKPYKEDDHD